MTHSQILQPVVALVLWTWVMWVWMYATRIPAIQRSKLRMDNQVPGSTLMAQLPAEVRWKADNYNHLMEQPTLFYAIAISLALLGAGGGINLMLAWAYVVLRILHSLIQATANVLGLRFLMFMLSSLCLIALTFHAILVLMHAV